MTEAEWLACIDPTPMLEFLREKASDRKLRLFALACCCRILRLLTDHRSINAVLVADRYLDGIASREQLTEAGSAARLAYENDFQTHEHAVYAAVSLAIDNPYQAAVVVAASAAYAVGDELAVAIAGRILLELSDRVLPLSAAEDQKSRSAMGGQGLAQDALPSHSTFVRLCS